MKRTAFAILILLAACAVLQATPVSGVLLDTKGNPMAGATIYSFLLAPVPKQPCKPRLEVQITTDAQGSYSFADLPVLAKDQWRYLVAYLPGRYLGWTVDSPEMEKANSFLGEPRSLVAVPVAARTGRVVDDAGHPLAKVPVKYLGLKLSRGYPLFLPSDILDLLRIPTNLTSDAKGAYRIADVPSDAEVMVAPRKKGFAAKGSCINPADLRIVLVHSGGLEGYVKDAAGKPIKGANVIIFQGMSSTDSEETRADGRFVFAGVAPGSWQISATSKEHVFRGVNVTVNVGKTTRVPDLRALPTAKVSGTVTFADTGKPAAGVAVSVFPSGLRTFYSNDHAVTDAEGAFSTSVPTGGASISVYELPAGYVAAASPDVIVPKTGLSGVNIRLIKADIGKGTVVDESGRPVDGARVEVYEQGTVTRTGSDGGFSITLPKPDPNGFPCGGSSMALLATKESDNLGAISISSRTDLTQGKVEIALKPIASVKVHVSLPSGKPAAGANLSTVVHLNAASTSTSSPDLVERQTDSDGNATANGLLFGATYDITASLPSYYDPGRRPEIIPGSELPAEVSIKLVRASRAQSGKVIDEKGKPVAGADVSAEGSGLQMFASTKSDAQGNFTVRGLPDSDIRLNAEKDGRYGGVTVNKSTGKIVLQIVR